MKSVLPAALSVRMRRSNKELAHDERWIESSLLSLPSISKDPCCCTTAGSCLWSPTSINRSIARPSSCRAVSIPTIFGSSIWLASSMMTRSKCLMLKRAERLFMVEVVATMICASDRVDLILLRVVFSSSTSCKRWSLYFGSQLYSLPMRM